MDSCRSGSRWGKFLRSLADTLNFQKPKFFNPAPAFDPPTLLRFEDHESQMHRNRRMSPTLPLDEKPLDSGSRIEVGPLKPDNTICSRGKNS